MSRYYTRVCNFYFGRISKKFVKEKKTLPLNGNNEISFDQVEIFSRKSINKIFIKDIKNLPQKKRQKITKDIQLITKTKKNFYESTRFII